MSVELYRESPGSFDSSTLNRKTLNRWTGRMCVTFSMKRSLGLGLFHGARLSDFAVRHRVLSELVNERRSGEWKPCWQKPCWQIYAHGLHRYVGASARVAQLRK